MRIEEDGVVGVIVGLLSVLVGGVCVVWDVSVVLVSVVELIVCFGRCNVLSLLRESLATKVYGAGGLVVFDENLFGFEGWDDIFVEDVVDDASFMLIVVVYVEGLVPVEVPVLPLGDLVVLVDAPPVSAWANDVTVAARASAAATAMAVFDAWPVSMIDGTGVDRSIVSVNAPPVPAWADDVTVAVRASVAVTAMVVFDARPVSTIDGTEVDRSIVGAPEAQDAALGEDAAANRGEAVDTLQLPAVAGVLVGVGYTKGVGLLLIEAWRVLCGSGGNVFDGCVVVMFCVCFHWEVGGGEGIKFGWWRGKSLW